jgi:MFS family permease
MVYGSPSIRISSKARFFSFLVRNYKTQSRKAYKSNTVIISMESTTATDVHDSSSDLSYQQLDVEETEENGSENSSVSYIPDYASAHRTTWNFTLMSILFSANHGCVVSCLALATARLGSTGASQSGILYLSYTASALLGATYVTKRVGSRKSLFYGMALYCIYVGCFLIATIASSQGGKRAAAYTGAVIGGIGAGFLWTAQGSYFGSAAEEHARQLNQPVETSTAHLAGIFAFYYLAEEVALRLLSSFLLSTGIASWEVIFCIYTFVSVISIIPMPFLKDYHINYANDSDESASSIFKKATVAVRLLVNDKKMKWMVGLNAVFGFTAAFLGSFVNGEVVPTALDDPDSKYIGVLTSWVSGVAAVMSLLFAKIAPRTGKGPILIAGAICFFCVVFPFLIEPNPSKYSWGLLIFIYTMHGCGRATFEGTLKATFADFFPYEKEGAFANIILQNGLSGAIGYMRKLTHQLWFVHFNLVVKKIHSIYESISRTSVTFGLLCQTPSKYCIEYSNGTLHDILSFELIVVVSAIFAIIGYLRASHVYQSEQRIETSN